MLSIIKSFGKYCSCHLQGVCVVVGRILAALYKTGSRWRVGFDGADWWSGRAGCYLMGEEHVVEEKFVQPLQFTLKMAAAMFAETLDNIQHSTRLTPESRNFIPLFQVRATHCSKCT
jgi:hypothetical protein